MFILTGRSKKLRPDKDKDKDKDTDRSTSTGICHMTYDL